MHILFICTANLQRSVAAEEILNQKIKEFKLKDIQVQSAGVMYGARRRVDEKMLEWADRIYVMEDAHLEYLKTLNDEIEPKTEVLHVLDLFPTKEDPELRNLIEKKLHGLFEELQNSQESA